MRTPIPVTDVEPEELATLLGLPEILLVTDIEAEIAHELRAAEARAREQPRPAGPARDRRI
jgi:hypothetical protein